MMREPGRKDQSLNGRRGSIRSIEPWYSVYALLGALVAGLIPILLPLFTSTGGNAAVAGLVIAAVSLGGLTAPLWGGLVDRFRMHKIIFVGGLSLAAVATAFFPYTSAPSVWCGLGLMLGIGAAAAATVANLFVVEVHPKKEWDERIGWLLTFYGVGQVSGLLLASVLSRADLRQGFLIGAGIFALAALLGWLTARTPLTQPGEKSVLILPVRHGEGSILSPQRFFRNWNRKTLERLGASLRSPFGGFLAVWLLAIAGSAAVFSLFPVLMREVFGISSAVSSAGFALAAAAGLLLYAPAGKWSERLGPGRVFQIGLGVRWAAFAGMGILSLAAPGAGRWLALPVFGLVVLAWSLLSVSGTAIAAGLSPNGEGEGMGIFNAANALANVIGAALGGWIAGIGGYRLLLVAAVMGVGLGMILVSIRNPTRIAVSPGAAVEKKALS